MINRLSWAVLKKHEKQDCLSLIIVGLVLLCRSLPADGGENWPQFRGPTGLGYSEEKDLPLRWGGPAHENVLWKSPLNGSGHASPIVWGDAVFVCTVKWPGNGDPQESLIPDHHVARYRVADGKLLWDTVVPPGPWLRNDFRSGAGGGYAGPTPVTDGRLVYCVFGSAVIAALDFQGKIAWRKKLAAHVRRDGGQQPDSVPRYGDRALRNGQCQRLQRGCL